jgi:peptidylprolyl isomerase
VRRTLLALLVASAVALAACGGGSGTGDNAVQVLAKGEEKLPACGGSIDGVKITGKSGTRPTVKIDTPFKVDDSKCHILTKGTGDKAEQGDTIVLGFEFYDGRTGKSVGAAYDFKDPASVVLNDQVLRGVRIGLAGAQRGERVVAAISSKDGYGPAGGNSQAGIEKDDSLVFVADVIQVRHTLAKATGTAVPPVAGLPTVKVAKDGKPTITVPAGAPAPATLISQPLIKGAGAAVANGQTVTVEYTGVLWATGKQFDSSWDRTPTTFQIGKGQVISGWDKGLLGQTVGSQVLLVIPPGDAYGAAGAPNAGISGTDTLVFVVDILDAR